MTILARKRPRSTLRGHAGGARRSGRPPLVQRPGRWLRRNWWRRALRWSVYALAAFLAWLTWSLGGALTAPGTDTTAARLAEWARFHGLGWAVSTLEQVQYQLHPPVIGGAPSGGIPHATTSASSPVRSARSNVRAVSKAPAAVPSQAHPALPGEGKWQSLVSLHGHPGVRAAFLRPDDQHTSYVVAVAWMDPRLVRFVLHPGTQVPGGAGWAQPPRLPMDSRSQLVATFNSGFTMVDAQGGYWQAGKQVGSLRRGAASMVFYRDGHVDVGMWGRDDHLGADVVAVRQNLDLLVDNGTVSPLVSSADTHVWGKTLGHKAFVWRSALGIRRDGSLVFVVGPAMSVATLARVVHDAGAVRAMELDINPEWTSFMTYTHGAGAAVPHLLTRDEQPNPYRYLQTSSRDFVAVYGRP